MDTTDAEGTPVAATPAALIAAIDAGEADTVRRLLEVDPALAEARGDDGVSALLHARYRFDRETLQALLDVDPEMDVFDAAALGHLDRLRERLDDDPAAVAAFSPDGFTPLHLAAFFGKEDVTRELLARGASVDAYGRNDLANQPLHAAAAGRQVDVCRLLLSAGADVSATQHGGYTPLHEAAQSGDVVLVELFLSAGADRDVLTDDGRSAADLAAAAGHTDLATRLRE